MIGCRPRAWQPKSSWGEAVCAFNPISAEGMTVAALGPATFPRRSVMRGGPYGLAIPPSCSRSGTWSPTAWGRCRTVPVGQGSTTTALAADVTHEAFVAAYRHRHRYRGDAPSTAWLHCIVVNQALTALRRRRAPPAGDLSPWTAPDTPVGLASSYPAVKVEPSPSLHATVMNPSNARDTGEPSSRP